MALIRYEGEVQKLILVANLGEGAQPMPSSYVVGERFEAFIKSQIQQGRYASAIEVSATDCVHWKTVRNFGI